ncbi:MAG: peptidase C39 family protein [Chloroflexi bacterium]|nr:peptidase C39 family protein [Chloroflexota bacterium]
MKSILLPVPHVQQRQDGECIVACAAMILNYLGTEVRYEKLLRLLRTDWFGTPASRLRELETLGIVVIYKQGTLQELHDHLSQERPCIALVQTLELPYWQNEPNDHAVTVVGFDDQFVYINDPSFSDAPKKVSLGDFDLAWLERDEYYAAFKKRS